MRKAIFYLLTFTFLFSIISCSTEKVQSSKSGVLKQPIVQFEKVNSKGDTGRSLPPTEAPLMFWKSFE